MDYRFNTQYLGVTDKSIYFLRNRFPYKEIKQNELQRVQLTRGTDLKRPTLSIVFGTALLLVALFLIINHSGYRFHDLTGTRGSARTVGYLIVLEIFFVGLGAYSIYKALPIHRVLTFTMNSGDKESFSVYETVKEKKIDLLITSLTTVLVGTKIEIDTEFRP